METKLGNSYVPCRPRRKRKPTGMFTEVEDDIAQAVKRLAIQMDVSCASVVNAILRKSLKIDPLAKYDGKELAWKEWNPKRGSIPCAVRENIDQSP